MLTSCPPPPKRHAKIIIIIVVKVDFRSSGDNGYMTIRALCLHYDNRWHGNAFKGISASWSALLNIKPLPPSLANSCHDPEFFFTACSS